MNGSALMFFGMKLQTYEKFKSLKDNEMFKSLDENDFLMLIFNKIAEDITLNNLKSTGNENAKSDEIPIIKVKAEEQSIVYPFESEITSVTYNCPDCKNNFFSAIELENHIKSHSSKNYQYICSCREGFDVLQSFLKHNYKCSSSKTCIKDEPTNENIRHLSDIPINTQDMGSNELLKITEYKCDNCFRKFRTLSSLYLHQCQKKLKTQRLESSQTEIHDNTKLFKSVSYENDKPSPVLQLFESPPVLTCHCLMEFFDYNQYFKHTENCGKSNTLENSFSNYSNKSSPLKVLPNSSGKYECTDCPKSFTSILSLRQHRDGLHRPTPKFVCKNCGKGYRWCTSFHYHKAKCSKS